ncbi:hypothetical protein GAY28_00525 [Azospirillum brasilense]|nr:hypothetical protein [Azospirillum brasilense]
MICDINLVIERIKSFHEKPLPPEERWYGVGAVFRRLADLPDDFPLRLQINHGPYIEDGPLAFYDNSPLPVLVCRKSLEGFHSRRPGKIAFSCGTAQVWYRRMNNIQLAEDAAGTLAFPCHSTHHIEAVFDHSAYAKHLLKLPDHFQPVTVCMYWIDILNGYHQHYIDMGIPVVSAGHMADPLFLSNFYGNLRRHRYTTGNEMGTHAILSIEMGIPYFHSGSLPYYEDRTGGDPDFTTQYNHDYQGSRPMAWKFLGLLPKVDSSLEITSELKSFVSYLHGADEALDRIALRRFIVEAYLMATPAARIALNDVWGDRQLQSRLGLASSGSGSSVPATVLPGQAH